MASQIKTKLGDILVQTKKITEEQLQAALSKQKLSGKRLGELLIDEKLLNEDTIIDVLEIQLGITRVDLISTVVNTEAVKTISESLARRHNLIPIDIQDNKIKVVMSDPLNVFAIDDVTISSGYEVETYIAPQNEIKKAIDRYYSSQLPKQLQMNLLKFRRKVKGKPLQQQRQTALKILKMLQQLDL